MTTAQKAGAAAVALIVLAGAAFLLARDRLETVVRTVDRRLLTPPSTPEGAPAEPPMEAAEVEEERPKSTPSPSLTISGVVLSPSGEPMKDARVRAYLPNGFQHGSVHVKRDGTFKYPGLEQNSIVRLEVEARRIMPVPREPEGGTVHLGDSNIENIQIQVMDALWLRGTVVNSAGEPQPGIDVIARRVGRSYGGEFWAESDLHGNISFGIAYGEYEFYFRHGYREIALEPEPQRITVSEDTDLNGVVLLCPDDIELRRVITGVVTDSTGKPVSDAEIQSEADPIRGPYAKSKSQTDGTYAIVVDKRAKRLSATHPYYSNSPWADIDATAKTVNLTLQPVAKVQGRVIDARTGARIPEFRVYTGSGSDREDDYSIVRDDNGEFVSTNVKAGNIGVWVAARGYADGFTNVGPIAPGEVRSNVEVRLTRGVVLEGRVVDPTGKPVRLARVTYKPADDRQLLIERFGSDISNDDGYFLLQSIPVGPVTLQAVHEQFIPKIVHLNVVPGMPEVRIVFEEGGGVIGHVTIGGRPVSGMAYAGNQNAPIGSDGGFTLQGLKPGDELIRFHLQDPDGAESVGASRMVKVPEHGKTDVDIVVPAINSSINGRVTPVDLLNLDRGIYATSYLKTGDSVAVYGQAGDTGAFSLNVPSGPIQLTAYLKDGTTRYFVAEAADATQEFRLDAGKTVTAMVIAGDQHVSRIALYRGEVDTGAMNTADFAKLNWKAFAASGLWRGETTQFIGIPPGAYTIVATSTETDPNTGEVTQQASAAKQIAVNSEDVHIELELKH